MFRFFKSSMYALEGLWFGLRTERNVQIWFGVLFLNLAMAFWLDISKIEWLFVLSVTFTIGISEYMNTAIEALADRVSQEREEAIKRVKDLAAAATFCASTLTFIVSAVIYIPKIIEKFEISI
ncbi:MAG: diacylglycerol kinase [Weeksellaceae bacterium]|nr:diacylglycerol kinase [Weeksellaceae bacterium]